MHPHFMLLFVWSLVTSHSFLPPGFLLLSIWSWVILCAPDYFSWNFSFMVVNAIQTLVILYNIRPVKFCDDLEGVYVTVFQPLRVPRSVVLMWS